MNPFTKIFRLLYIQFILARHGIDDVILSHRWFAPIRFITYLNPWNWGTNNKRSRGERLRQCFEDLGPIFVKFGQMLSTRRDILVDDIADELALLQDKVPAFSAKKARKIIERELGRPINEIFSQFDNTPLASASIAQVHAAELISGEQVIVKVLRPEIKKIIKHDVALLYTAARFLEKWWEQGQRLHPVAIVKEFEKTLMNELDLMHEAANASQIRRNFLNSKMLYVPKVYWSYVKHRVMVMERIYGIPIYDFAALKAHNIDLKKLAERLIELFFTQVFRDCFFHADMHPGNIFVSPDNPQDPQIITVDFGISGSLSTNDQHYLAANFLAFFKRDYRRVAELHIDSGWVPYDTRPEEFEAAIRAVSEPAFEKPLKEISIGQALLHLFQTARRFNMEVQPQLLLLQKTLLNIEGLGRQLNRELDLWQTATPFLEHWIRKRVSLRGSLRKLRERIPFWTERLPELPDLIYESFSFIRDLHHHYQPNYLSPHQHQQALKQAQRKHMLLGGIAGVLISVFIYHFLL
jgi:ubiquinone biosynthesis protein